MIHGFHSATRRADLTPFLDVPTATYIPFGHRAVLSTLFSDSCILVLRAPVWRDPSRIRRVYNNLRGDYNRSCMVIEMTRGEESHVFPLKADGVTVKQKRCVKPAFPKTSDIWKRWWSRIGPRPNGRGPFLVADKSEPRLVQNWEPRAAISAACRCSSALSSAAFRRRCRRSTVVPLAGVVSGGGKSPPPAALPGASVYGD